VLNAYLCAWIKKPQLRTVRKGCLDQITIAAFDDPLLVVFDKATKQAKTFLQWFSLGAFFPSGLV
jgi:hypothetical protein